MAMAEADIEGMGGLKSITSLKGTPINWDDAQQLRTQRVHVKVYGRLYKHVAAIHHEFRIGDLGISSAKR